MIPANEPSKLLTTNELAQLLKMHPATIRADRCGANALGIPYVRIGRAIRYRPEDVLALLETNRITA